MKEKKVLIVGPINKDGIGGRLEEMKIWANVLQDLELSPMVFSPYFSSQYFGKVKCVEIFDLFFHQYFSFLPKKIKGWLLRIWYSRFFKKRRDQFYKSKSWHKFASSFSHVLLFITNDSPERQIFESYLSNKVLIRFTGTISDFNKLNSDGEMLSLSNRSYIFHSKELLKGYIPKLPYHFIDQTCQNEEKLLNLAPVRSLKTFAMVGLFMEVKQMDLIIKLFKKLPQYHLLIFGKGELETYYRKIITDLDITNVELKGFLDPEFSDKLYQQFDALIINSAHETGPLTGVEAMAAGRLIFSKPIGSMPSRLKDYPWFIFHDLIELQLKFEQLSQLPSNEINKTSFAMRDLYLNNYSYRSLTNQISSIF